MKTKPRSIKAVANRAVRDDAKARKGTPSMGSVTLDSFVNFAQKLGVGADNAMSTAGYGFNPISRNRNQLDWMHRGSWLAGIAVDCVADDMTRAGIEYKGEIDPEGIEKINEAITTLGVWNNVNQTIKWARLYGGCIAVMMIDGQDMGTPLRLETVGKGQFKGLLVLDRWMVEPSLENLITEMGPSIGLPKFYSVTADSSALPNIKIHHTRCIRLDGVELPYWQRVQENLWGISVLERLYDRMIAFDSATTGSAQLVYKAYIRTYKVKGLREVIAAGGPALQGLTAYVDLMRRFQGQEGITLLDGEDEMEALTHSAFSGLNDTLNQFGQQLSGALQIPLVRLFGQSPAGFNGGDMDLRMYYDSIRQQQNKTLKVPLTRVVRAIAASEGVALPEGFGIEFNPLWQLTEEAKSTIANTTVDAVTKAQEAGLISDQVAMKELKQSSRMTGLFSNITDEDIEAANDTPEQPPTAEELALEGENGLGPQVAGEKEGGEPSEPTKPQPSKEPAKAKPADAKKKIADKGPFKEEEHPRKPDGKFGSGGGTGASTAPTASKRAAPGVMVAASSDRATWPEHIKALAVPPAWTNVHYSENPKADLLVVGKDAQGRRTPIYSPEFEAHNAAAKFNRIKELNQKFGEVLKENKAKLKSDDPRVQAHAECMELIMEMGVRPGSTKDTKAKRKAYGATTLEGKHVVQEGNAVFLQFVGKSGKDLKLPVTDAALAAKLKARADKAGSDGKLFPEINEKTLLDYSKQFDGGGFKTKDFRTLLGTRTAMNAVAGIDEPKDEKSYKEAVKQVATIVSRKLGNTPTVALQSYISPVVFAQWRQSSGT